MANDIREQRQSSELEREVYLDERKLLINLKNEAIQNFDKTLTALATGAIGLSIAFVKQIAHEPINYKWILFIIWILFTLSLASILFSFMFSQSSLVWLQESLDEYYQNGHAQEVGENPWMMRTERLNWCSLASFILGVLLFAIFVANNLP